MMIEEVPYMTDKQLPGTPIGRVFPICNLIDEIADDTNISDSFDYVVSHLESAGQREHIRPKKAAYCRELKRLLSTGQFRITQADFRTIRVTDGPKERIVQAPTVFHRVGCHSIMVPFERHTYPTLIKNTAASIKGRGMHWLHQIIEEDLLADPDNMQFFYQSDILGYYDHISQEIMRKQVREYTSDPLLLPMLDNFITLLPLGLSKGLRASQCLANLHLNKVDHKMCELVSYHEIDDENAENGKGVAVGGSGSITLKGKEIRYHYYRYCDDIVIFGATKKELWLLRDYLKGLLEELGLTIKPSEAIRPEWVGLDYLGYVTFTDDSGRERVIYSRIRKRTKQKFARKIKKVKSRKRRQSLIGSFFGMAAHADCRHLLKTLISKSEYKKLKHKRKMKDFGDVNIVPARLDGKKNFRGGKVYPRELDKQAFIIVDFERDVVPRREKDEYQRRLQDAALKGLSEELVEKPKTKYLAQVIFQNSLRKLWTGDRELWDILEQLKETDNLPIFVAGEVDFSERFPKLSFVAPQKYGFTTPSDEELDQLLKRFNLK